MSITSFALGVAAATAAAVIYANNRARSRSGPGNTRPQSERTSDADRWSGVGGGSMDGSPPMPGSTPGQDSDLSGLHGSSGMGAAGRTMSGADLHDTIPGPLPGSPDRVSSF